MVAEGTAEVEVTAAAEVQAGQAEGLPSPGRADSGAPAEARRSAKGRRGCRTCLACKGGAQGPQEGGPEVRAGRAGGEWGVGGGPVCGGERPYSRSWTCMLCARRKKKPGEISGISHSDEMRDLPCD